MITFLTGRRGNKKQKTKCNSRSTLIEQKEHMGPREGAKRETKGGAWKVWQLGRHQYCLSMWTNQPIKPLLFYFYLLTSRLITTSPFPPLLFHAHTNPSLIFWFQHPPLSFPPCFFFLHHVSLLLHLYMWLCIYVLPISGFSPIFWTWNSWPWVGRLFEIRSQFQRLFFVWALLFKSHEFQRTN